MKQRIVAELLPGPGLIALLAEAFGEESQIYGGIEHVARGIQPDEIVDPTCVVASDFDTFREWLSIYAHFFDDTPPLYPEGGVEPTD